MSSSIVEGWQHTELETFRGKKEIYAEQKMPVKTLEQ